MAALRKVTAADPAQQSYTDLDSLRDIRMGEKILEANSSLGTLSGKFWAADYDSDDEDPRIAEVSNLVCADTIASLDTENQAAGTQVRLVIPAGLPEDKKPAPVIGIQWPWSQMKPWKGALPKKRVTPAQTLGDHILPVVLRRHAAGKQPR